MKTHLVAGHLVDDAFWSVLFSFMNYFVQSNRTSMTIRDYCQDWKKWINYVFTLGIPILITYYRYYVNYASNPYLYMDITHNISTLPILSLLVLSRMHICGSHLQIPKALPQLCISSGMYRFVKEHTHLQIINNNNIRTLNMYNRKIIKNMYYSLLTLHVRVFTICFQVKR